MWRHLASTSAIRTAHTCLTSCQFVCLPLSFSVSLYLCLSVCLSGFISAILVDLSLLLSSETNLWQGRTSTLPPLPLSPATPQFVGFCCRWLWFRCACVCVCGLVCVCAFFLVVIVAKQQCDFTLVFLLAYLCVWLFCLRLCVCACVCLCVCVCVRVCLSTCVSCCIVQSSQWNVAYQSRCVRLKGRCGIRGSRRGSRFFLPD